MMFAQLLLYLALISSISNPLASAMGSFHRVATYRLTIQPKRGDSRQIIRYFSKKGQGLSGWALTNPSLVERKMIFFSMVRTITGADLHGG